MTDREIAIFAVFLAFLNLWEQMAGLAIRQKPNISFTRAYVTGFIAALGASVCGFFIFMCLVEITNV